MSDISINISGSVSATLYPKAPRHIGQFRGDLIAGAHDATLQGHSADRTISRL
jgi:hypothetical protein